jgi:hypothetical protein
MAEQTARNWSSGDIVTAANLSSIERGVSAVAEEYTPTTWANGNTVTAAGLNNIELGIVNAGGGGSSDFSTATVTVTKNGLTAVFLPTKIDIDDVDGAMVISDVESGEYIIPLYKGHTLVPVNLASPTATVSVSGSASYEEGYVTITGDCTITISSGGK